MRAPDPNPFFAKERAGPPPVPLYWTKFARSSLGHGIAIFISLTLLDSANTISMFNINHLWYTARAGGLTIWKKMYHYVQLHRDEFMDHSHKRSNIEATNAAIKRKFGEMLKSKNPTAQVNELLAKIVAYNLTVVIHEMYDNGINPGFLEQSPKFTNPALLSAS